MQRVASLADALNQASWSPRQLARSVNERLGAQGLGSLRIDATAAYPWVRHGYRPRPPIPALAAAALSEHLGFPVTVEMLWPGRDSPADAARTAVAGLDETRTVSATLQALGTTSDADLDEGQLIGAPGSSLLAAVTAGLQPVPNDMARPVRGERLSSVQLDLICAHVEALRRLDDHHGGGTVSLRYATAELRAVLELRWAADLGSAEGGRLLEITTDLVQLVGWLHFDARRSGPAQRYLLLGARLARAGGHLDRMVNILGMLCYVSAFAGHGPEAVRIIETAIDAHPKAGHVLAARLKGRQATAAAANGDLRGFRSASSEAQDLLTCANPDTVPSFLYYLEPAQLTAESGQSLVALAARLPDQHDTLLREAVAVLEPISGVGQRPRYPRSALLHATFLTEAHLRLGNLPEAVAACRAATSRLAEVRSGRGRGYLASLRPALARRARNQLVSDFLPELDRALSNP